MNEINNSDKIYRVDIDGVPVSIKVLNTEGKDLSKVLRRLEAESLAISKSDITSVVKNEKSITPEKIGELGLDIISVAKSGKNWIKSKTIWTNVTAIITIIAAKFGFDIDPNSEFYMMLPTIMALVNIYLRKITDTPIKLSK